MSAKANVLGFDRVHQPLAKGLIPVTAPATNSTTTHATTSTLPKALPQLLALPLIWSLTSCQTIRSIYSPKESAALSSMPVFEHDIQFALKPFNSCKELATNLRDSLVKGINAKLEKRAEQYDPKNPDRGMILPMATEATSVGGQAKTSQGSSQDFTKTNNQVAGVEEGDVVVTDGQVIYQAVDHEVRRYKVDRSGNSERLEPIVLDKNRNIHALALTRETPHRLVVVATFNPDQPEQSIQPVFHRHGGTFQMPIGQTAVAVYNLEGGSDTVAAEPRLVDTYQFTGYFDQLRLTGHTLRVLSRSSVQIGGGVQTYVPNYDFKAKKHLTKDEYDAKTRAAIASNLRQVHKTSDSALLSGGYTYTGNRGDKTIAVRQTTEDCKRIYSNARKLGLYQQFTDVMSIDLSDGDVREDKFLLDSSESYFTGDTLYLTRHGYRGAQGDEADQEAKNDASADANERLSAGRDPNFTTIHKLSYDRLKSSHQGSVTIPGSMLNRYSMSEYDTVLRVAVTENRPKFADGALEDADKSTRPQPAWESESYVYTLGDDANGKISVLGRVGGLGKNERIYAVRYFGEKGYVVTFRKTDPLYTLDLSDPTEPKVIGELKIPGFSTYMHGIGNGRLLAIGKDADLTGRVRGVKVSLFDVSDFSAPRLASELVLAENSYSEATYNPKAFNWNALRSFLAIPMSYWYAYGKGRRNGDKIIGVMVDNDKLVRADDFAFARDPAAKQDWLRMKRAIMVGDALYTITEYGVKGYHYQKGEQADN